MSNGPRTETMSLCNVKFSSQFQQYNLIFRPVCLDFGLSHCGDASYLTLLKAIMERLEPSEDMLKTGLLAAKCLEIHRQCPVKK
jgi:hypothetical protein